MNPRGQARALGVLSGAQGLSQLGDQLSRIALVALIWSEVSPPAEELLRLLAVAAVPSVLGALLAGSIADRYPSRLVLIVCDVARGLLVASFPFLHALGDGSALPIYAAVPVLLALNRAFRVCRGRLLPGWVDRDGLGRANALLLGVDRTAEVTGAAVAGIIVVAVGWKAAFVLDGVSYLLSAALLVALPRLRGAPSMETGGTATRSGWRGMLADARRRPALFALAVTPGFVTFAAGAFVVVFLEGLPGVFGGRAPAVSGALMSAIAAGAVLAAVAVRYRDPTASRLWTVSLLCVPVCWVLAPDLALVWLVALAVLGGGAASYLLIGTETLVQRDAARPVLGRWLALKEGLERAMFLLGLLAAAALVRWGESARGAPVVSGALMAAGVAALAVIALRKRVGSAENAGRILLPGLRLARGLTRWGPVTPALAIAAWAGRRTVWLHRAAATSVRANQALAGVSVPIDHILASYARYHVETAALGAGRLPWFAARTRVEGWEHVERARETGSGLIFATAHLGNWDLGAALSISLLGEKAAVFAERLRPPALYTYYVAIRERYGAEVLQGPSGVRRALSILGRGGVVSAVADRPGDGQGLPVPFGSGITHLPSGPYRLAQATGAIVLPAVVLRRGNGYLLRITAPLSAAPGAGREVQVGEMAREFAARLLAWVGEAPEQWIQLSSMTGPPASEDAAAVRPWPAPEAAGAVPASRELPTVVER